MSSPTTAETNNQSVPFSDPSRSKTLIVTVSGGVAEIAENPGDFPVEILDFDNLLGTVYGTPTEPIALSEAELNYLEREYAPLYATIQPRLAR
jgi:hypothetical protein